MKNRTFKEIIVTIWGDEFPIIERMSPAVFRHFFGTWPGTKMEKVTLLHTYKLSVYVVDDHTTVLDCLISHTNLKNKRDENKLSK